MVQLWIKLKEEFRLNGTFYLKGSIKSFAFFILHCEENNFTSFDAKMMMVMDKLYYKR